jgi:hypothetical protein
MNSREMISQRIHQQTGFVQGSNQNTWHKKISSNNSKQLTPAQQKQELENLVDLKLQISRSYLKSTAVTDLKHDPVIYLKVSKVFDIIDDLVLEERNRLKTHLETYINKKIPVCNKKWKENTATPVKISIHLEVDLIELQHRRI